jgi:hypothetical protein
MGENEKVSNVLESSMSGPMHRVQNNDWNVGQEYLFENTNTIDQLLARTMVQPVTPLSLGVTKEIVS